MRSSDYSAKTVRASPPCSRSSPVFTGRTSTIAVNGKAVSLRSPQDANAVGIGIVHQEQSLFTNLSVAENIVMGLSKQGPLSTRFGLYRWGQVNSDAAAILSESAPRLTREQR